MDCYPKQKRKFHTYMSQTTMFANTSHKIELKNELIIIDEQFFAPYALKLKTLLIL